MFGLLWLWTIDHIKQTTNSYFLFYYQWRQDESAEFRIHFVVMITFNILHRRVTGQHQWWMSMVSMNQTCFILIHIVDSNREIVDCGLWLIVLKYSITTTAQVIPSTSIEQCDFSHGYLHFLLFFSARHFFFLYIFHLKFNLWKST